MIEQKICPQCGKINPPDYNFCKECGFEIKEYCPDDFVVIENLKVALYSSISCIALFIGFMILVTIALISQYSVQAIVPFLIIWAIIIGFMVWATRYLRDLSKIRKFIITDDYIEIVVPNKQYFKVYWSDFDSIEITKRESMTTVPTTDGLIVGPKFVYFTLIFKGTNYEKNYEFESGKDFKVRTKKKIITVLEQYADKKGKNFTGWKWKDKRRAKKAIKN